MIIDYTTSSGKTYKLKPRLELYAVLDFMGKKMPGIAIVLDEANGLGEQFGFLTVSFGEFIGWKNCAYIDTNNMSGADVFLKLGVARDTGCRQRSGYCTYPMWKFDENFLKECGAENYEKYSNIFNEYFNSVFENAASDDNDDNGDNDESEDLADDVPGNNDSGFEIKM